MESAKTFTYEAHGKLLLTAEYVVLDGAKALCLPTQKGQRMLIEPHAGKHFEWQAYLPENKLWFQASFNSHFELVNTTHNELGLFLLKILKAIKDLNPDFILNPLKVSTFLEFNKDWGLGSSSTLISLLSQWAEINPYDLLEKTFGGSGYDIACATASQPLFFQDKKSLEANFNPSYANSIFFIYQNKKQNSRESIHLYKNKPKNQQLIKSISSLTDEIAQAKDLASFEKLLLSHEKLISQHLNIPTIQEKEFMDYSAGVIKSLGGWGGDFILVTGNKNSLNYFRKKGYRTIFSYSDLIL